LPALFVSDLHLSARRPETTSLFFRFLAGPARGASALYILGDLFDAWAGDDDLADPFNTAVSTALADLATSGIPVFFSHGNRDFLAGAQLAVPSRLTFIDDETVVDLSGTPTLLLHGDTLCTDDADYQRFRAAIRAPNWQRQFLALPLAQRKAKIEELRAMSETAKGDKAYELMDANADAIAVAFRHHNVSRIIHGHTHRQARHDHLIDGRARERWVLGDWQATGSALSVDTNGCRWLTIT
jgi:UDP-2,3-diacylglucosamine hydrolase